MKRKCNILVVDDEPNVLLTYRLILQQQGYEVCAALSSESSTSFPSSFSSTSPQPAANPPTPT